MLEIAGAGAATTFLAGCSGGDGEDGGDGDEGSDGSDGNDDGDGGADTSGSDGGSDISGTVKIGHLGPLDNPIGVGSARSAQLAVDAINDDGGIADADVKLVRGDTRNGPTDAQGVVDELIREDEVDVLVGTFSSEVTQAIIDLTAERNIPFIISGSAAPSSITEFIGQDYERYKNLFGIRPINSNFQAEAMGQYASYLSETHGWDSLAIVADDAEWTMAFREQLPDIFGENGIDVVMQTALQTDTKDFSSVLGDVADSGADAMFRFFAHINGGPMMAQWAKGRYEFGIEGIHVTGMVPAYYKLTQGTARYETTAQSGASGVTAITEKTIPFTERYVEEYGDAEDPPSKPMYMGYNTADAIHVYANAAERAGTVDYENGLDSIVEGMLRADHVGRAGHVTLFDPDSEYPHDVTPDRNNDGKIVNYPITQWQAEGAIECVYPPKHQTAEHTIPAWMK